MLSSYAKCIKIVILLVSKQSGQSDTIMTCFTVNASQQLHQPFCFFLFFKAAFMLQCVLGIQVTDVDSDELTNFDQEEMEM